MKIFGLRNMQEPCFFFEMSIPFLHSCSWLLGPQQVYMATAMLGHAVGCANVPQVHSRDTDSQCEWVEWDGENRFLKTSKPIRRYEPCLQNNRTPCFPITLMPWSQPPWVPQLNLGYHHKGTVTRSSQQAPLGSCMGKLMGSMEWCESCLTTPWSFSVAQNYITRQIFGAKCHGRKLSQSEPSHNLTPKRTSVDYFLVESAPCTLRAGKPPAWEVCWDFADRGRPGWIDPCWLGSSHWIEWGQKQQTWPDASQNAYAYEALWWVFLWYETVL